MEICNTYLYNIIHINKCFTCSVRITFMAENEKKKPLICIFNEQISCFKTIDTIGRDSVKTIVSKLIFFQWFSVIRYKTVNSKLIINDILYFMCYAILRYVYFTKFVRLCKHLFLSIVHIGKVIF